MSGRVPSPSRREALWHAAFARSRGLAYLKYAAPSRSHESGAPQGLSLTLRRPASTSLAPFRQHASFSVTYEGLLVGRRGGTSSGRSSYGCNPASISLLWSSVCTNRFQELADAHFRRDAALRRAWRGLARLQLWISGTALASRRCGRYSTEPAPRDARAQPTAALPDERTVRFRLKKFFREIGKSA